MKKQKYKYVLFDLDGTLTDPKEGITKSIQYALKKYDILVEDLDSLEKCIGPPLKHSFMEYYNFTEEQADQAIEYYREYYSVKGMIENKLYRNIENLLKNLCESGLVLIIATTKPTVFAKQILKHFNLIKYFEAVVGSELDGTRSEKCEIIKFVIDKNHIKNIQEIVMIGDRKYDIIGAHTNNIDSIGVTYGYGSYEELKSAKPTFIVESVKEIYKLIL